MTLSFIGIVSLRTAPPYPDFSVVNAEREFLFNSTVLSVRFICVYARLYLASMTAFNSIFTSAVFYLLDTLLALISVQIHLTIIWHQHITYAVAQAIFAVRGRSKVLPNRPFILGRQGYIYIIFVPLFIIVLGIFVCFPPSLPVSVGTMNYTSVVFVGLFLIIPALWLYIGKRNFHGPQIDWEMPNAVNVVK
jgi:choline transport protein